MKILIIGGTGNISRWLTALLAEDDHDITLYNRGKTPGSFNNRVKYIIGDRKQLDNFQRQMEHAGLFDCVIDMVGFEPEDARHVVKVFKGRIAQFIFCSTVDVYSKQQLSYPVPLDQLPGASPDFEYAFRKMQMEHIFRGAFEGEQFPVTVIRPAATYSEGYSPLLTSFGRQTYHLSRLLKGLPVILHGDGHGIWVETHASDVARAFAGAIGKAKTIGRCYNVTGDELLTWRSMHRIVADALGAPPPSFVPVPVSMLERFAPEESVWCSMNFQYNNIFDNTAAKEDLGYVYTIPYGEGAKRCIRYLQDHDAISDCDHYPFYETVLNKWHAMSKNK